MGGEPRDATAYVAPGALWRALTAGVCGERLAGPGSFGRDARTFGHGRRPGAVGGFWQPASRLSAQGGVRRRVVLRRAERPTGRGRRMNRRNVAGFTGPQDQMPPFV